MADPFLSVSFHTREPLQPDRPSLAGVRGQLPADVLAGAPTSGFNNDEAAARFYLEGLFSRDERPAVRGLVAPAQAKVVPELRFVGTEDSPLTRTRLATFDQTRHSIPIFGSRAVVELTDDRGLVAADATVAPQPDVSSAATISVADARNAIADLAGVPVTALGETDAPTQRYYFDEEGGQWHLAYLFEKMPVAPEGFVASAAGPDARGHGLGPSPRSRHPLMTYLVDAHDAKVLLYYSATPLLDQPSQPTQCQGVDEDGQARDFFTCRIPAGFELRDPWRRLRTYDLGLADLERAPLPAAPVANAAPQWGAATAAAVSAHVNATHVHDFIRLVLQRDGIDGHGMDLISVVNCTDPSDEPGPQWHNAQWWKNAMWYGQAQNGGGMRSFSRYLDVIAHELTHGITETTSGLIYRNESGALNESFSDIFGIIIKNWYEAPRPDDVAAWNWELGQGLGSGGLPLRDLSNPARTGDPDHMNQYKKITGDSGGVHSNSNIHNKAAYLVLTATDAAGRVFKPKDVAILYFLTLQRLNQNATFAQALQTLTGVTRTYFAIPAVADRNIAAITQAYATVGIHAS